MKYAPLVPISVASFCLMTTLFVHFLGFARTLTGRMCNSLHSRATQ